MNQEKFKKLQLDNKLEREAEKSKFSPKGLLRGSLTPMNPVGDSMSQKSAMYSTIKEGSVDAPVYNDFLNDIFTVKRH